jgi:hypothetical protein
MVEHRFTNSSAINWCKYDPDSMELEVCFQSGSVYRYSNVPENTVKALCQAQSAGKFFHAFIATSYSYSSDRRSESSLPLPSQSTIQRPETKNQSNFYGRNDVKPLSLNFSAFNAFRKYVLEYCAAGSNVKAFNHFLKTDKKCNKLRSDARSELQNIYIEAAIETGLPKVSVFLPTRKKISVMGSAITISGIPNEIRVYCIHGPSHKDYSSWMAEDIMVDDASSVCETLLHEIAHIHEAYYHRVLGHEETFIEGYLRVEQVFLQFGFEHLLTLEHRFVGCPRGSKASLLEKTPR